MPLDDLIRIINNVVNSRCEKNHLDELINFLNDPRELGISLCSEIMDQFKNENLDFANVINEFIKRPYLLLPNAFEVDDRPETPTDFYPVPLCITTIKGRYFAVAVIVLLNMEIISYKSEIEGQLFVNLVTLPGEGRQATKSYADMRGHTDGVSFPFRGKAHDGNPKISPSPDCVCLIGIKNPNKIPTLIMPLADILEKLDKEHINELEKSQYGIDSQTTFKKGMKEILGDSLFVENGEILLLTDEGYWIRFSHSKIDAYENGIAEEALEELKKICKETSEEVVVNAGDILLINNRKSLHGRREVGKDIGGDSRWILRCYGLRTDELAPEQRYADPNYMLYP